MALRTRTTRRRIATILAMALAVAACSPATPTTAPRGSASPATTFHFASDLENLLPADVAGTSLTRESVLGTGFQGIRMNHAGLRCRWYEGRGLRCRDQKQLASVVARLNKALKDVRIAVGYDRSGTNDIEIQALRIAGASGRQILDAVLAVERGGASAGGGPTVSVIQLGGRSVTLLRPKRSYPSGIRYRYASADTLYEIRKAERPTVEATIAKLQ